MADDERGNPFESWEPSKRDEVWIGDVIDYLVNQEGSGKISQQKIREKLKATSIVCESKGAKGSNPVLIFTNMGNQWRAIKDFFGVDFLNMTPNGRSRYIAEIEVADKNPNERKIVKTRMLYSSDLRSPSPTTLIVSQGLQNQLGTQDGDHIRIVDVYQDLDSVNLDDLLK